jgi:hypothetical protein
VIKKTGTSDNHRVERLVGVLDILHQLPPVNLWSTMLIIAPRSYHQRWQYAVRETRAIFKRAEITNLRTFEVIDIAEFERMYPTFDDQYIFLVDDVDEDQRKRLGSAIKKLKLDDGHRLFMTKES